MKNQKIISILAALLAIGLAFAAVIMSLFLQVRMRTERESAVIGDGFPLSAETANPMPRELAFTAASLAAMQEPKQSVDVRLAVTVTPASAAHKEVDFALAWKDAPTHGEEPVTDYVDFAQDGDGSCELTLSCYQGFGKDTISLTVTTRDGGFTDECLIRFEGRPSAVEVRSKTLQEENGRYKLSAQKSYEFELAAASPLWNVGGTYSNYSLVSVKGSDQKLIFDNRAAGAFNPAGSSVDWTEEEHEVSFADVIQGFDYVEYDNKTCHIGPLFDIGCVTVSGSKLKISTPKAFSELLAAIIGDHMAGSMGSYTDYGCFKAVAGGLLPEDLYIVVTVKENTTGVTGEVRLSIDNFVAGVEFNDSSKVF